ncbi:hypothetical protein AGLY_008245 [Aphis glycines]|uniref:Uncharacterized protein n=1 Tax=Aphis glycines TaxID=307491 RepID=A0A6G0TMJ0_APHGL|nr:hypothetical protein AGLY_008245 [Aphis glycines]
MEQQDFKEQYYNLLPSAESDLSSIVCSYHPILPHTSAIEAWLFNKSLSLRHPTTWPFIEAIQKEQSLNEMKINLYIAVTIEPFIRGLDRNKINKTKNYEKKKNTATIFDDYLNKKKSINLIGEIKLNNLTELIRRKINKAPSENLRGLQAYLFLFYLLLAIFFLTTYKVVCLQYSLTKLEFFDEITFGDEFDDI